MTTDHPAKKAFSLPTCPYCNATITQQQVFRPGHCGAEPCFIAHIEAGQAKLKSQRDDDYSDRQNSVREQADDAIQSAAASLNCDPDDVVIAVVPYQNEPLEPLSDAARDAFVDHVRDAAAKAFAIDPENDKGILISYGQNTEAVHSIIGAGCTACQGFCCKRGGGDNHAFITRQSIYYIRTQDPDLTEEDIVEHFENALPDQSVKGACVYQSAEGCTLTREWRASLCNTFLCHDIHAMHDVTGGRLDVPLVIAGINDDTTGSIGQYDIEAGFIPLKPESFAGG